MYNFSHTREKNYPARHHKRRQRVCFEKGMTTERNTLKEEQSTYREGLDCHSS